MTATPTARISVKMDEQPFLQYSISWFRVLTRDKSDTLLLLTACAMVLLPHFGHLPWWTSVTCAGLLAWRGWITLSGQRLPPIWLLLPLALLTMAGVYADHRTLLGRDAGVAMLVLLLTFKLLEMRARRDLFVVLLLSFFLLLTTFFYSQSVLTALMMIVTLVLILTVQLSFQYTGIVPPLRQRLRLGGLILALAVPLTLVLFLVFPRIQGPLWGLPGDAHGGRSGLSDSMAPGNISELALSDDIAFRIKFLDPPPAPANRYWRGAVLGDFDGRTWTQTRVSTLAGEARSALASLPGAAIRQQITMEPNGQRWLFALEAPRAAPTLEDMSVRITGDHQIRTSRPIGERVRYDVISHIASALPDHATPSVLQQALRLPENFNPRTLTFAATLRSQWRDDTALVNAALDFFRHEHFIYTLEPPLLGKDSVDDFLFSSRAGFCEHYASAFVVLMRAAGIPARVVTGYQGGEINSVDGMMTVRQSDAHAWSEVWLPPRGWVRIDPTAAAAPGRIETQLNNLLPRSMFGGLINLNPGQGDWWSKLSSAATIVRANWEALNNGWNQWALNYTPDRQRSFLAALGFEQFDWRALIALMSAIAAVAVGTVTLPLLLARSRANPLDKLYSALCARMAGRGIEREKHEGPSSYRRRLCATDSPLPPATKLAVERFMNLYEALRYGADCGPDNIPPAPLMAKLKLLLSQCR
ncbi:transglutaminase TgpA family protein [Paraherbaspirillum soli]|uniref:DUF3488 and DUF4129 domain-containing transglutaminase family protein n=1 Tax=Paraherbaspirillum soli TaxID=631222 RepID=A0ABW0M3J2_9BURK